MGINSPNSPLPTPMIIQSRPAGSNAGRAERLRQRCLSRGQTPPRSCISEETVAHPGAGLLTESFRRIRTLSRCNGRPQVPHLDRSCTGRLRSWPSSQDRCCPCSSRAQRQSYQVVSVGRPTLPHPICRTVPNPGIRRQRANKRETVGVAFSTS